MMIGTSMGFGMTSITFWKASEDDDQNHIL